MTDCLQLIAAKTVECPCDLFIRKMDLEMRHPRRGLLHRSHEGPGDLEQANRERLDWKRWLLESEQQVKSLSEQLTKAKE